MPAAGHYVSWMVLDGNHRVAAAIIREDSTISATIEGQLSYADELFNTKLNKKLSTKTTRKKKI